MDKELFTITEKHLDSGLRGYPIGYCVTSKIDPEKGVFYKNYHIKELVGKTAEEVMYLLIEGKLPNTKELNHFKENLNKRAHIKKEVKEAILKLPRAGHPMKMFAAAVLLLGMYEVTGDVKEDFLNLQAKIGELTAIVINHSAGWGETLPSKPELGIAKNFTQMLLCPTIKDKKLFTEFMDLFINLHMDHGGGNLSLFVAKAVASGHEDLYGSYAAAILALAGPRHGKANQDSLIFVRGILKDLGDNLGSSDIKAYVQDLLANKKLIYGFGHAALRCEDPRATCLFDFAKKHFSQNKLIKLAISLNEEVPKILKENPKIQNPYSNVDSISGIVLTALGFDFPDYFTVLFGLSRLTGVGRQVVYETLEAREGKGVPIYRPKYLYKET
jgi:citrate synthase